MSKFQKSWLLAPMIVLLIGTVAQAGFNPALTYTFGFSSLNYPTTSTVASQLLVDVSRFAAATNTSPDYVKFHFTYSGAPRSAITGVFFDDGTLLGISSITDSGLSVSFHQVTAVNQVMPSGNLASPPFVVTQGFSAESDNPAVAQGVTNGEYLDIVFALINNKSFSDTLTSLTDGSLRIGLKVQGLPGSEEFINKPRTTPDSVGQVPAPGAALLGLIGLGVTGWVKRRLA